jgi:serine/threonine-protein kinase
VAVAYQHVNADAVSPSSLNPKVSPALDAVVLRAMSKDRFERFQSASEFRSDVEAAAAGALPAKKTPAANDFNATLFGVNPNALASSEATMRQLTVDTDDRAVRTQNRPPVAWIWAGIASMFVIIVAVVIWTLSLTPTNFGEGLSVDVPDVIGQSYEDAADVLTDKELTPLRFDEVSDTVPEGEVLRTDPPAATTVAPESEVRVYVSSGKETVPVPQVGNMTEADAIKALESRGLVYGTTTTANSASVPKGVVISSDPVGGSAQKADGTPIRAGDTVNLVVSTGLVSVPGVVGQTIEAASATLSGLQLTVSVQSDLGCTGGTVSGQSVQGEVAQKSEITIRWCAG